MIASRPVKLLPVLGLVTVVALLTLVAVLPVGLAGPAAAPSAPRVVRVAPAESPSALAPVSATAATAAPSSAPASPVGCPSTPGGTPNWNGNPNFFADAVVNVAVPGQPGLSGQNFAIAPCSNTIPTYENGFWVNVTTNVPITQGFVYVWGTAWPTPTNRAPDLPGFSPTPPVQQLAMYINPPTRHTASFYFNVYRYFWPGSQVYFNISLQSTNASPSTIYSTNSAHIQPYQWGGGVDNWTWSFGVASPFSSTNFSQDIGVATTPSIFGSPSYPPNDHQQFQITLTALNASGGPALPIPQAIATIRLSGRSTGTFSDAFGPVNHTVQTLLYPIGPYPATSVSFNITAWFPWEGGSVDRIYSLDYAFNWSDQGGWTDPSGGLTSNLWVNMTPSLSGLGPSPVLAAGVAVNVSIHSPTPNVTIGSAAINYRYTDANGETDGVLPMAAAGPSTAYAVLPGLPPGGAVTFSIIAKDIHGNLVASGNYSYREAAPLGVSLAPGYGLFFFEVIDVGANQLVPNVNFTIANDTWSEKGVGYPLGFAGPRPITGAGYLPVAFGVYSVTVTAFGQSQTWSGTVSDQNPFVVLFYLTSRPVGATYAAPIVGLSLPAGLGILGAAIAMVPVRNWFKERRAKAEAEQRRITL